MSGIRPCAPPTFDEMCHVGALVADRYRIEDLLGEGAMGAVFEATDVALGRRVALKVASAPPSQRLAVAERLREEARLMAQLQSERVVSVLDIGELDDGMPFVVLELLDGLTLSQVILRQGQVTVDDAVHYIIEACLALSAAHAIGMVHRDVKPENLFLVRGVDGVGRLKLLDFGVSIVAGRERGGAGAIGTPLYMSPEQCRSPELATAQSDIWSLGVMLYEMLTGHCPFDDREIHEILRQIAEDEPIAPRHLDPTIPVALDAVVMRCLTKDPTQRFDDVGQLALALAPFGRVDDRTLALSARCALRDAQARDERRPTIPVPEPAAWSSRRGAALVSALSDTLGVSSATVFEVDPLSMEPDSDGSLPAPASEMPVPAFDDDLAIDIDVDELEADEEAWAGDRASMPLPLTRSVPAPPVTAPPRRALPVPRRARSTQPRLAS